MRLSLSTILRSLAAYLSATVFAAMIWLDASESFAAEAAGTKSPPPLPAPFVALERAKSYQSRLTRRRPRPSPRLGRADELATLHAIHTALSSVGDGGAFVWQRGNGLLNGLIRPTTSFKAADGKVCRHLIIRLDSQHYTREIEGIACREESGRWSLAG